MRWTGGKKKPAPAGDATGEAAPALSRAPVVSNASAPTPLEASLAKPDRDLLHVIDARLRVAAGKAGAHLACKLGCTECCIGPFPINRLDAARLRRGLRELEARDPQRAAAIRTRAAAAIREFAADFPGDADTGRLSDDRDAQDRFFGEHSERPCPVLDPATGGCDLYEHRPLSCRSYGPPVTFGGRDLPPCRLCFTTAAPADIEKCRVEPDPDGLEEILLARLIKTDGEGRETIIAYAVAER